uniref:C3H1-type domain-containing protein n=1 Tax=Moniliophthora roreri TaxID=221103 RepID=A0A0W0FCE9_MONRR
MASTQLAGSTVQLWFAFSISFNALSRTNGHMTRNDEIRRMMSLANATIKQHRELESRIAELELQLAAWKQAHAAALDTSEAYRTQIATLNRQISSLDVLKTDIDPLILCLINGDDTFFSKQLLELGYQGGQNAAQHLTKGIAEFLSTEDVQLYGRLSFWIILFVNKDHLAHTLAIQNVCTQEQLDAFLTGFTQASPRFLIVDICRGEASVEVKIKGCFNLVNSGSFAKIEADGLLGKFVLLHSFVGPQLSNYAQSYKMPCLQIEGLLMENNLLLDPRFSQPSPVLVSPFGAAPGNGGLVSPQSPVHIGGRFIDASLPLHKRVFHPVFSSLAVPHSYVVSENPPPCNEHYLMTCSKGAGQCKYSHEYVLSPEQLASLASNAKKAPCNWLKNGNACSAHTGTNAAGAMFAPMGRSVSTSARGNVGSKEMVCITHRSLPLSRFENAEVDSGLLFLYTDPHFTPVLSTALPLSFHAHRNGLYSQLKEANI